MRMMKETKPTVMQRKALLRIDSQFDVTEVSDREVESDNEEAYDSDSESTTVI